MPILRVLGKLNLKYEAPTTYYRSNLIRQNQLQESHLKADVQGEESRGATVSHSPLDSKRFCRHAENDSQGARKKVDYLQDPSSVYPSAKHTALHKFNILHKN